MTEYTAHCDIVPGDTVKAFKDATHVVLTPSTRVDVCLTSTAARTFACGILSLADEIDGGEAPEPAAKPKVGDRVRIVRNDAINGTKNVGEWGTLARIDDEDDDLPYRVSLATGSWWCAEVALAAETTAATVSSRPKVGDRVRVLEDDPYTRTGEFVGKVGTLMRVDDGGHTPFKVQFGDGSGRHGDPVNGEWYVTKVQLADAEEAPVSPRRAALDEAVRIVGADAPNVADVARFLAGE